ncbi:HPr family phosphocarrier protein [Pseudokordiimonas caeni]|uniref:HPr family phosphocarrier protein n=1 Tax=Pseudokordiimonas caeni TaxID=2997908 RepID=UPI002810D342|nr:HPr family phosphocarrier protein [Pseudokordiimonas caeni]
MAVERTLEIINMRGLHARASAALAKLAGEFSARINVSKDGTEVTATSIMGLMMLGAAKGDSIDVSAEGADADDAMNAIAALVANRFGEER